MSVKIAVDLTLQELQPHLTDADLKPGADVTHILADNEHAPLKVTVIATDGGSGWPYCELEFADEEHGLKWFADYDDDKDYFFELVEEYKNPQ